MQVTALTQLATLKIDVKSAPGLLDQYDIPSSGFGALTALAPTLRRLSLGYCNIPDTLSTLTGLEFLGISMLRECPALAAALPHLQHLTDLRVIHTTYEDDDHVSPLVQSLTALTRLRVLSLFPLVDVKSDPLPGGQWLAGLRQLALPIYLFNHEALLASAEELQLLAVGFTDNSDDLALLDCAVQRHLQGQRLPAIHLLSHQLYGSTVAQLVAVARQHPDLPLHVVYHDHNDYFDIPFALMEWV